jgi:hypothetical protein
LSKSLVALAKQVAEEEDLIYAPDVAALSWMHKFAKIVTLRERERCAQKVEDAGHPELAKLLRNQDL